MHTISFYSFKGGVGRSMAVYYLAKEFAKLGKRVVVADFDFEAPGLPYKFKIPQTEISAGLIDYIHTFYTESRIPDSIAIDCKPVPDMGTAENPVLLLPAGASHQRGYWQKLHEIDWKKLLYQQESYGRAFFLEWKLRLEEELKPDVLLIDSRTGIHDLTAVTMHLLSDQVLVLGVNNDENIDGCRLLLEILKDHQDPIRAGKAISAHFALTRLPIPGPSFNYKLEQEICNNVKDRINSGRGLENGHLIETVHVVHSDDRLLINEKSLTEEPREDYWRVEIDLLRVLFAICEGQNLLDSQHLEKLRETTQIEYLLQRIRTESDLQIAKSLIEKATKIDPDNIEIRFQKGVNLIGRELFEQAIGCFDYVIAEKPTSINSYYQRSRAKERLKKIEDAINDLLKAMTIDQNSRLIIYNLARIYQSQGRFLEASKIAIQLVNKGDMDHFELLLLGDIQKGLGNTQSAVDFYHHAVELKPNYAIALRKLGLIFLQDNRFKMAYHYYSKALEIEPNSQLNIYVIGAIHLKMKNYGLAIESFVKCLELNPTDFEAMLSLTDTYIQIAEYSKAKSMIAKALKIRPTDKRILAFQKKLPA